ncbi:MAG: hypothetical protein OXF75_08595 [Acidimicrobiaceae bacterium]|nr:hypothetical protein [Acidimicrobiaceae bacterium]
MLERSETAELDLTIAAAIEAIRTAAAANDEAADVFEEWVNSFDRTRDV